MARLTAAQRRRLRPEQFALPGLREFPIEDVGHVKSAAGRITQAFERGRIAPAQHREALGNLGRAEMRVGIHGKAASMRIPPPVPRPPTAPRAGAAVAHTFHVPALRAASEAAYDAMHAVPGYSGPSPDGWRLADGTEVLVLPSDRRLMVGESGGRVLEMSPFPNDVPMRDLVAHMRRWCPNLREPALIWTIRPKAVPDRR